MSNRLAQWLYEDFQFTTAPSVVEFAEQLVLPKSFSPAMSGPYSTRRTPTSRPILECWRPSSGVRKVDNVAGSQTSKTTEGIMGLAYRIVHSPMPALVLGPSEDWLRTQISELRLMSLIDANPILSRMKPFDSSHYRKLMLGMIGGAISLEGANSPVATAGSTQGIVMIMEAAKIEHQAREDAPEAHPIKLAFERTKAFRGLDFHWQDFTPNRADSIPWRDYEAGSQTHFYVPCPHCGHWFPFEFELRGADDDRLDKEHALRESQNEARPKSYRSLVWNPDARDSNGLWNAQKIRESTVYLCPKNGCEIREEARIGMIANFETRDHNPLASKTHRSFRRPSFYSPTITFADMALEFLRRGDLFTTGLQNFYNSWLAQPWEKFAANIKDEDVRRLRDVADYRRGILPRRPVQLVIAGDVGDYRTHYEVGAIYDNDEIGVIDWGTVLTIEDLLSLPAKLRYPIAGTDEFMSPAKGLVDSRDQTVRVYDMCSQSRGFWWPAAGSDAREGTWGFKRLTTHPLEVYTFNTHQFKKELYIELIKKQRSPRFYLPRDTDEELIQGHAGQQLVITNGKDQWKKLPNDHFGDCSLRLILARVLLQWRRGLTAPDMTAPPPPPNEFPES